MCAMAVALGVAGGSGSGKTTVARRILEQVGEHRIAFLVQDRYYRDVAWRSREEQRGYNFDHPDALDCELLVEHLVALRSGCDVMAPVYDFRSHTRCAHAERIEARPVILVERILLFAEPRVRELLDFKVFVDTDSDVRLIRRLERDLTERGRSLHDVLRQYLETVRPMHLEFIEPSKRFADVIVPEGGENRVAMEMVVARIEELLRAARG